jgi:hypothetical protein
MSEKPHCFGMAMSAKMVPVAMAGREEQLRTLMKSSDIPIWKFWRLTFVTRVLIKQEGCLPRKAMKMQGTKGVCTVEAGQCIQ